MIKEIEQIDKMEAGNQRTELLHSNRLTLKSDLNNIDLKQTQLRAQRSKKNWFADGDENTVFYFIRFAPSTKGETL